MGRVIVVGSINVDMVTFVGRTPTPGETVRGQSFAQIPGGKGANQALAACRSGAQTRLIGAVGSDVFGDFMMTALHDLGVDTGEVERLARPTGVAQIMVCEGENRIVVVPGANEAINLGRLEGLDIGAADVCVAQLETGPAAVRAAFTRAREKGARTLFNPAPADADAARDIIPFADVIVANESEWGLIGGAPFDVSEPHASLLAVARSLAVGKSQMLVATLGSRGVCSLLEGRFFGVPAHAVMVVDTTGAGDCFCGYLAAELARGAAPEQALRWANAAAALAVQTLGAAAGMPRREQVERLLEVERADQIPPEPRRLQG